jgi:hypothetical protein
MTEPAGMHELWHEWRTAVNMTATQLEDWLETKDSASVHDSGTAGGSTARATGRRIVSLLHEHQADITDDEAAFMRTVVAEIHHHLGTGVPQHDQAHSKWRFALMNLGHDPLR